MDLGVQPAFVPPSLTAPPSDAASAAELAKRGATRETARKFESSFLSMMVQQMFAGVETSTPFGGGPGEDMFKSFLAEAMAERMSRAGGVGVADTVMREMLKMQGLK